MTYDFRNLSPADFEDLVRDLIGREFGVRFEAFAVGPDGGIDGRHARSGRTTILQAKHYVDSTFPKLKSAMKRERASIDALAAKRYVLATSRPLTPANKKALAAEIGPTLKSESDIWGAGDLNAAIRINPDIEKAHIKLWLSSASVLDRLLRPASQVFNRMTREEIEAKLRVFAPNPSLSASRTVLESQHVLIISGPPGVGKTTLAEMLAYAYLAEGWELVSIRSLDDGFASIADSKKQIFLFDDFLGAIALDKQALAAKDSDLARLMRRIRSSPNARFILTTRAYIFEEARRVSEHLADQRLDISKYVLDVGVYTRRIRARILYNHLLVAGAPNSHIRTIVEGGTLPAIVDHKNYNPRVIAWMTDIDHLQAVTAETYADAFIATLTNPRRLWDTAFRSHIAPRCRHLLIALFFFSQHGTRIRTLRAAFDTVHAAFCTRYGIARDPKDFEEALKILEGGFLTIRTGTVSFVNPSLRDFMQEYVSEFQMLLVLAPTATSVNWAAALWQVTRDAKFTGDEAKAIALALKQPSDQFERFQIWEESPDRPHSYSVIDASNAARISLLLDWWKATADNWFASKALACTKKPIGMGAWSGFNAWTDGRGLVDLVVRLTDDTAFAQIPVREVLLGLFQTALCDLLEGGISADDLATLSTEIDAAGDRIQSSVHETLNAAIAQEFDDVASIVENIESASELDDHIETLERLAPRASISPEKLKRAQVEVSARKGALEAIETEAVPPSFVSPRQEPDKFDDNDLLALFKPLLEQQK